MRQTLLEVLFFVALGVFGFSLVSAVLGGVGLPPSITFLPGEAPDAEPEQVEEIALYAVPSNRLYVDPVLSPIFTASVIYWSDEITEWSASHNVDPNLAATVMQIESCGNPSAQSGVGATGLFQVMPFHFQPEEEPFDPDTNAFRGLNYLADRLEQSGGHAGLALAGYNGGHTVISRDYDDWPHETQRYFRWGSGIYREASAGWTSSPTLTAWLSAGGASLCRAAENYLGINTEVSLSD